MQGHEISNSTKCGWRKSFKTFSEINEKKIEEINNLEKNKTKKVIDVSTMTSKVAEIKREWETETFRWEKHLSSVQLTTVINWDKENIITSANDYENNKTKKV